MARKLSSFAALLVLVLTATPVAGGTAPGVIVAGDDTAPTVPAAQMLTGGNVYEGAGYELSARGLLVEASPTSTGVSEVRIAIALRNTSPFVIPAWAPGVNDTGFPTIVIRDATGVTYDVDTVGPNRVDNGDQDAVRVAVGESPAAPYQVWD